MTSSENLFGAWLKRRRRQLDLTQKELARQAHCSEGTIRKIEGGSRRPSKQLARLLAQRLDVPAQQVEDFVKFSRAEILSVAALAALRAQLDAAPDWPIVEHGAGTIQERRTDVVKHNLPPQATLLMGRARELATLDTFLASPETRVVSLVGPGGIGKTRLVLACAQRQTMADSSFRDGIYFVDLAPLVDIEQIVPAIIEVLQLSVRADESLPPERQLLDHIRPRKMLLILDNFEHVLQGAELVARMWRSAPKLRVLITSRERLNLRLEQVYQVEGLTYPQRTTVPHPEAFGAVQMFLACARRHRYDFELKDEQDRVALLRICQLVAGMPLALELAATWVASVTLPDIVSELQRSLDFLEADLQDLPERHWSMRAAIRHTWRRLSDAERTIFVRLSVFRGGFTSEAAASVAVANAHSLGRLVKKSLVQFDPAAARYRIHELMRQYGDEKLRKWQTNDFTTVQLRHGRYYCRALQRWEPELKSARQPDAKAEIEADYNNIQAAWRSAEARRDARSLLISIKGLGEFYKISGRWLAGIEQFKRVTAVFESDNKRPLDGASTQLLLWSAAWQVQLQLTTYLPLANLPKSNRLLEEKMIIFKQDALRERDTRDLEAFFLLQHASLMLQDVTADLKRVEGNLKRSLRLYKSLNDPSGIADSLYWYHILARAKGEQKQAQCFIKMSLTVLRQTGEPRRLTDTLLRAGVMATVMTDFDRAAEIFWEALTMAKAAGDSGGMFDSLIVTAYHAWYRGEFGEARRLLGDGMAIAERMGNVLQVAGTRVDISQAELYMGQPLKALLRLEKQTDSSDPPIIKAAAIWLHANLHAGRTGQIKKIAEPVNDHNYQLGLAWMAIIGGQFAAAVSYAERAQRQAPLINVREERARAAAPLSYALAAMGRQSEACSHLVAGTKTCLEIGSFRPLLELLPVTCYLLSQEHDSQVRQRALAWYSLIRQQPYVRNSQLFLDLVGKPLRLVEASLPPRAMAAERSKLDPDWWTIAGELLSQLLELSTP